MDPLAHGDRSNALDDLLKRIPAYRGYLERDHRRESDKLARTFIADQLRDTRNAIDRTLREWVDAGKFDRLTRLEAVRTALDGLELRVVTAPRGYGAFFDYVQVDRKRLDDILFLDLELGKQAEGLRQQAESLEGTADEAAVGRFASDVEKMSQAFEQRRKILSGLNE